MPLNGFLPALQSNTQSQNLLMRFEGEFYRIAASFRKRNGWMLGAAPCRLF
jgi:hypothetical protein